MNKKSHALGFALLVVAAVSLTATAWAEALPGKPLDWQGFKRYALEVHGHKVSVWAPNEPAEGGPWALLDSGEPRAVDVALLRKGFHIVSMELPDPFGSPKAVAAWDALYAELTGKHGLSEEVVLEGYGLGGLIVYNWGAPNANKVACIHGDGAVGDFKSYPGGQGKSEGDPALWKALQDAYGFASEQEALDYAKNPVDTVILVGEEGVPVLHVVGQWDKVVPPKENTVMLRKNYWGNSGKEFTEIVKERIEHEYGLEDPLAIVNFICLNTIQKKDALQDALPEELGKWKIADGYDRRGKVHIDGSAVILEHGNDMTGVNWGGSVPTMNYEITFDAMRVAGDDFFCGLTFPYGESPCTLVLGGWGGSIVGLSCIDFNDASENETTEFIEFQKGKWYRIRLRVTEKKIEAWLGEKQIIDLETEGKKIDIRYEVEPSRPLGISTWRTTGAIKNWRLRELVVGEY